MLLASSRQLGFLPCVSRDDDDDEDTFVGRQFLGVSPPASAPAAQWIASTKAARAARSGYRPHTAAAAQRPKDRRLQATAGKTSAVGT